MDHDHGHETTLAPGSTPDPNVCIPKMDMSLHWGTCEWILIRTWKADTLGKFIFAAITIFLMAALYEGLKHYREILYIQSMRAVIAKYGPEGKSKLTIKERLLNVPHGVQTFLHGFQIFISYILMLIVMLCNMNLIIAIVAGAAAGYFLFGWLRSGMGLDKNECCY